MRRDYDDDIPEEILSDEENPVQDDYVEYKDTRRQGDKMGALLEKISKREPTNTRSFRKEKENPFSPARRPGSARSTPQPDSRPQSRGGMSPHYAAPNPYSAYNNTGQQAGGYSAASSQMSQHSEVMGRAHEPNSMAGSQRSSSAMGNYPGHAMGPRGSPSPYPTQPSKPVATPTKFNWLKGELLGQGAYGKVYLGLNLANGEFLAVKEIQFQNVGNVQERVAALQREISVMKELDHENIVRYYGAEREGCTLNIFLEYVAGGSLSSLMRRFGRLSENIVRIYTKQILTGLHYLHENRIAHRDIKGANILVNVSGVLKLADFGASRQLDSMMTLTNEFQSLKGTPHWMAPEVITQTGHGRAADIWSVGCTIIEMVTGKPPFSEFTTPAAAMFHIASTNEPPAFPDFLSEDARSFLCRCFVRNSRLRATAAELLDHPFLKSFESPMHMTPSSQPDSRRPPETPKHYEPYGDSQMSHPNNANAGGHQTTQAQPRPHSPDDAPEPTFTEDDSINEMELQDRRQHRQQRQHRHQRDSDNNSEPVIDPVEPRQGYDNPDKINKFLAKRSAWLSSSFSREDISQVLKTLNLSIDVGGGRPAGAVPQYPPRHMGAPVNRPDSVSSDRSPSTSSTPSSSDGRSPTQHFTTESPSYGAARNRGTPTPQPYASPQYHTPSYHPNSDYQQRNVASPQQGYGSNVPQRQGRNRALSDAQEQMQQMSFKEQGHHVRSHSSASSPISPNYNSPLPTGQKSPPMSSQYGVRSPGTGNANNASSGFIQRKY